MLQVNNLSLKIGAAQIFSDVSFSIGNNEIVALVGPNGAGKTSLLKTLLGLYTPSSGTVIFSSESDAEVSLLDMSPSRRATLLSYVPQRQEQALGFTVAEFVEMALYAQNFRFGFSTDATVRVAEALARVKMERFSERNIQTLSGGELQKVYLAGALAQCAQIALLDEPTAFLDPAHQFEVSDILINAVHGKDNDDGNINNSALSAALLVTHDVNLALAIADRVLALKRGKLLFFGSVHDFANETLLTEIYEVDLRLAADETSGRPYLLPPVSTRQRM